MVIVSRKVISRCIAILIGFLIAFQGMLPTYNAVLSTLSTSNSIHGTSFTDVLTDLMDCQDSDGNPLDEIPENSEPESDAEPEDENSEKNDFKSRHSFELDLSLSFSCLDKQSQHHTAMASSFCCKISTPPPEA